METTQLFTVRQAASETGCSISQIMRAIRSGKLKAEKVGWVWTIRKEDLEEFRSSKSKQNND